jgi:3'(2'), 5'-bisphosphate nucleotidase
VLGGPRRDGLAVFWTLLVGEWYKTTVQPTQQDHSTAKELATAAGGVLVALRGGPLDGSDLKDAGDAAAHEFLLGAFTERFPDDGLLSEEGADDTRRLDCRRAWIVDPLDGTREYSERPRVDWAVHVALAIDQQVVAGAVALPGRNLTLATGDALPAPCVPTAAPPRIVVSRTRPTEHARLLAERLHGELVPMGSAGAKAMAVVLNEADIYAHSGGQYEWDSAAPVAVAEAAGFHVSRLDGSALRYNQADPWLPDLLICRPELAENVIEICAEADRP